MMDFFRNHEAKSKPNCGNIPYSHTSPNNVQKTTCPVNEHSQRNARNESQCHGAPRTNPPEQHTCRHMRQHYCTQPSVEAQVPASAVRDGQCSSSSSLGHHCHVHSPIRLNPVRRHCAHPDNNIDRSVRSVGSVGILDSKRIHNIVSRECENFESKANYNISISGSKTSRDLEDIVLSQIKTQELIENSICKWETSTLNTSSTIICPSGRTYILGDVDSKNCNIKSLPDVSHKLGETQSSSKRLKYTNSIQKSIHVSVRDVMSTLRVTDSEMGEIRACANDAINTKDVKPSMINLRIENLNVDSRNLTIEDVIGSNIVAPIMRRVHQMYIGNLQEELSLMQALYSLPSMVDEIYQTNDN